MSVDCTLRWAVRALLMPFAQDSAAQIGPQARGRPMSRYPPDVFTAVWYGLEAREGHRLQRIGGEDAECGGSATAMMQ